MIRYVASIDRKSIHYTHTHWQLILPQKHQNLILLLILEALVYTACTHSNTHNQISTCTDAFMQNPYPGSFSMKMIGLNAVLSTLLNESNVVFVLVSGDISK